MGSKLCILLVENDMPPSQIEKKTILWEILI